MCPLQRLLESCFFDLAIMKIDHAYEIGSSLYYDMMLLILDIASQNKYLKYIFLETLQAMLQLFGNLLFKLDAFVDSAFEFISPKKPKPKWNYQQHIITKNKWEIRLQKQRQKEMLKQSQENVHLQRLDAGLNKLNDKDKDKKAKRNQSLRAELYVNKKTMEKIEKKQFECLVKSIGSMNTSFLLPTFIAFADMFWLNEDSIKIIYNMIQTKLQTEENYKQNVEAECVEISSLEEAAEQSIPIFKGKIRLFPKSLNMSGDMLPKFVKRIEEQLSSSTVIIQDEKQKLGILEELRSGELQHILKQLRKAKIYRYELNEDVYCLIGRYLLLKKEETSQRQEKEDYFIEEFQFSDVGLFCQNDRVGTNEQKEIMQFWKNSINSSVCAIHSRFYRYEEKIIRQLNIKEQLVTDVKSYFEALTKFQQRLIQVQEEKSRHQVMSKKKELTDIYNRFEKMCSQSHVVKDKIWTGVPKDLPIASFSNSTALRIFKKWRSFDCSDNLSASKIIAKLITRQLRVYEVFELLLNDYDVQLIIPRNRYISQLIDAIASFKEMTNQLIAEEKAYRKIEAIKESITLRQRYKEQDKTRRTQMREKAGQKSEKCVEFDSEDFQLSIDEDQQEYQDKDSQSDEDNSDSCCEIILNENRKSNMYCISQSVDSESDSKLDFLYSQLQEQDVNSCSAQMGENEDPLSINENLQSQSQEDTKKIEQLK